MVGAPVPADTAIMPMSGPGGLGADFQRKVVANVVSQEANVRSLLAKVELGEADAAIVYASDAVAAGARRIEAVAVACVDAGPHASAGSRLPCGACRQVIAEFAAPDTLIHVDGAGDFALSPQPPPTDDPQHVRFIVRT